MENRLTPSEAFVDFLEHVKPTLKLGRGDTDLSNAIVTHEGKVVSSKGKVAALGTKRILKLLDKYAPGRYKFHEAYFTKK